MTGRPFPHTSAFAGDDGSAPPGLAAAVAAPRPERIAATVAALRTERVLVPVVAEADEQEESGADRVASAAMVTVQVPDGRGAIPVFSSVAHMAAWRADARPVPVEGRRAALAAGAEADALLVLDPGSDHTVLVPRPAVAAIAQDLPWTDPLDDEHVRGAIVEAMSGVPAVVTVDLEPGDSAEVKIILGLRPGLDRVGVISASEHASTALAASAMVTERIDSLEMRITTARG